MEVKNTRDEKQKEAVNNWARAGFTGSIIAGTGFGKSRVGVVAVGETLRRNGTGLALVLVPTIQLRDQFREEFIKWGYEDIVESVEFMCYQTAYKLDKVHYDVVVCDEVHLGLSKKHRKFFENNAYDRLLCMTATVPEDEEYKFLLSRLAPIVYEISLDECIRLGFVAPYEIVCIPVELTDTERSEYVKANQSFVRWKHALGQFDAFNEANRIIGDKLANKEDKKKAVMFYRAIRMRKDVVDNAENKLLMLKEIISVYEGKKILTFGGSNDFTNKMCCAINGVNYHSGISKKAREINLQLFRDNTVSILCSTKALNQGLDIPDAEIGIICGLTSKSLTMIQRIGRLLRKYKNKVGKVIILYVADSQEFKWLENATRSLTNITKIEDINNL